VPLVAIEDEPGDSTCPGCRGYLCYGTGPIGNLRT